jgi:hypothetical protein
MQPRLKCNTTENTSGFAHVLAMVNMADVIKYMRYKDPTIISGTGAVIWSKIKFGPTGHHHPELVPVKSTRVVLVMTFRAVTQCAPVGGRLPFGGSNSL